MSNTKIPPNLLAALQKIESSGTIPLLIPQQLENFLTEEGLYRSSMTPDEAWQTLRRLAYPEIAGETRPGIGEEEILPSATGAVPLEAEPTVAQPPQTGSTGNPLLRELRRRRGKDK